MNRIKREKVSHKYIASISAQDENTADSDPAILQEITEKSPKPSMPCPTSAERYLH